VLDVVVGSVDVEPSHVNGFLTTPWFT